MKKVILIFLLIECLSACKQKKVNVSENIEVQQSAVIDEVTDNDINEDYDGPLSNVIENLKNNFNYDFPVIIDYENVIVEEVDLSRLTDEELAFYKSFVGCYFTADRLSPEYLDRHIYEISLRGITNGIKSYSLGKNKDEVSYSDIHKCFYEHESFSTDQIKNINTFKMPASFIRITPDENGQDVFEKTISRKRDEFKKLSVNKIDETKARRLLINFFRFLGENNYSAIIDRCCDTNSFKLIKYQGIAYELNEYELINWLHKLNSFLEYKDNFKLYTDVYFSEDIKLIKEEFGKCHLLEFYFGKYDYLSFVVKKIGSEYKISGLRYELDEE